MIRVTFAAVCLLSTFGRAEVRIEAVPGQAEYLLEYGKATDFSGLTWARGDLFYAVSNRSSAIFPMRLRIAPTGRLDRVFLGAPIPVKSRLSDFEGIAYWPERKRLYISTERPPGIVGFDEEGDATFPVKIPNVFDRAILNKGLESLTYGAGYFWTANEDTLDGDGNLSSANEGALVRLQKIDQRSAPVAQFAYRTDHSLFRLRNTGTGVTDLVALPGGELLVLERVLLTGLLARIYLVDFTGATDTSKTAKLAGADITPVKKRLLFERVTGSVNYEGIALGPELADGWRSLVLIADSGGEGKHPLMPLRIRLPAAP
jgi:hypothetical protein